MLAGAVWWILLHCHLLPGIHEVDGLSGDFAHEGQELVPPLAHSLLVGPQLLLADVLDQGHSGSEAPGVCRRADDGQGHLSGSGGVGAEVDRDPLLGGHPLYAPPSFAVIPWRRVRALGQHLVAQAGVIFVVDVLRLVVLAGVADRRHTLYNGGVIHAARLSVKPHASQTFAGDEVLRPVLKSW